MPHLPEPTPRFSVVTVALEVAGRRWHLRRPESIDDLLGEENFDRDDRLPYWAEIWPSARVLAARIGRCAGAGRRLLELGCGVGLVSLAAAQAGFQVVASDYYAEALEFTASNARRNGVTNIATRLLDWRRWPNDLGQFDVIAASDVLYEHPNPELVAAILARTLAPAGVALVSDPGRRPAEYFPLECEVRGLDVLELESTPFTQGATSLTVHEYEIRRRAAGANYDCQTTPSR